jgi:transcriptional regulator with XRE-family HTH domain
MEKLGKHLKQVRNRKNLSMRQVEQLSKKLCPKDKRQQVSHTYLRKLEGAEYQAPSPFKLKSLATIYELDFHSLMKLANYIILEEDEQILKQLKNHLSEMDVNPDYFIKALLELSEESMALVNRTVSIMATQERELKKKEIGVEDKV